MAGLGRQDMVIPGQQLYGTMIPRPEHEEEINQFEKVIADKKMESFKDYLREISKPDGLSEYERKQLKRLDTRAATPMAIGYEVVPFEVCESMSTDSESTEDSVFDSVRPCFLRSVSIKLVSDKLGYVNSRESKGLILQSDGDTTYCISENSQEEEGIEVIGTGRFQSVAYYYDCSDETTLSINSQDPQVVEKRLSCVFQSTESTQIVYYQAPEREVRV